MTEVLKSPVSFSGGILKDRSAVSVKRYEAKPPANLSSQLGPNNGDIDAASPTFDSSRISSISNNRGERLSSTTNTTSVSFFSSSSSSLQVDPENVLATTKEVIGSQNITQTCTFCSCLNILQTAATMSSVRDSHTFVRCYMFKSVSRLKLVRVNIFVPFLPAAQNIGYSGEAIKTSLPIAT
ncbi:hypothetical protein V9T40_010187 [Parthenolecanium corni]|uniref:Uncharacterized protein n=1 Tax=Parthenolecanium corni TaxID=536013 RepID=A0AAN9TAP0_9HEMI